MRLAAGVAELPTQTVVLELPEDVVASLGSLEEAAVWARQVVALHLLREARITQGQAARRLGISHWDLLDLMAEHNILSGPVTAEEIAREMETVERLAAESKRCGDYQQ